MQAMRHHLTKPLALVLIAAATISARAPQPSCAPLRVMT
jgi:hypothetical protein